MSKREEVDGARAAWNGADERAWLTDADKLEDSEKERRRLKALADELNQRYQAERNRAVDVALRDLERALNRLQELRVTVEADDTPVTGTSALGAHWSTGKVKHVADFVYDEREERWSTVSTLQVRRG